MYRFNQTEIQAVIFDMDGLLIDSEPYWKIAEREVFGKHGLNLSDELLRQVMGFRLSEAVIHWYHFKPWPNPDLIQTEREVLEEVKRLISNEAKSLPGTVELLKACRKKKLKIGLASSSSMSLIELVIDRLHISKYFDVIWSAEYEPFGKPHPGIFLTTASKLDVEAKNCLVFEDSVNGVLAAKAARMQCIAVPESATYHDPRFVIADLKIQSLLEMISPTGQLI
jgi:sugar-phosphatase